MHGESSKFNYRLAEVFYNLKDYPACIYYANKAFLSDNTAHYKNYANNIMASSMSKLKMTKSSDDYLNLLTSIATWDKMPIKVGFSRQILISILNLLCKLGKSTLHQL